MSFDFYGLTLLLFMGVEKSLIKCHKTEKTCGLLRKKAVYLCFIETA